MSTNQTIATLELYPKRSPILRYFALWYFTTLLIVWNLLGHTVLGFEQAWRQPLVGLATAIFLQFFLEWLDARANKRPPRYSHSRADFFNFLPPAIIPGLAIPMLLYPNENLTPIFFAVSVAMTSKVLFRAPLGNGKTQHIFNPSNLGIATTLLVFPWVGLAPPYHFTENLQGAMHWVLPGIVLCSGLIVHACFTGRIVLVLSWLAAFVIQGQLRRLYFGTSWIFPLTPMTSAAFMVFTLYMIPDPATTPLQRWRQAAFGITVAVVYAMLFMLHVVFGLFIALVLVCAMRGLSLHATAALQAMRKRRPEPALAGAPEPALVGVSAGGSAV